MTTWRRRLGVPAVVAIVAAVLADAATTIVRLPGSFLPRLPHLHDPDYSRDARRLAPLRRSFVEEQLGKATFARVLSETTAAAAHHDNRASRAASKAAAAPTPRAASANHSEIADVLAPGQWDLRLEFTSDRDTVASGEDIVYTLRVRNVGASAFKGRLDLRSHVPLLTSYVVDPVCSMETLVFSSSVGTDACPVPSLPVPDTLQELEVDGQPVPLSGLTWTAQTTLEPGRSLVRGFKVTVDPGADGRDIVDHAHISVLGSPSQRSTNVVVHVSDDLPVHP